MHDIHDVCDIEDIGKVYRGLDFGILKRIGKYLLPYKNLIFLLIILTLLITFIELALPYILRSAIDICLKPVPGADIKYFFFLSGDRRQDLVIFSIIFLIFIIFRYILDFINIIFMTRLSQKAMHNIRMDVFNHIQKLSISFFDSNPIGRLVTRVTNDVQALDELFTNVFIYFFKDFFILLGILFILWSLNHGLTLLIFSILPFIMTATIIFRVKARNAFRKVRRELASLNAFIQEHIKGMEIIQLFVNENSAFERFRKQNTSYYESTIKQMLIMAVFNPFISFSSSLATALIVWYGGTKYLGGAISLGIVVAFLEYVRMFFRPLSDLTEKYNILQSAMAATERLFQILDTKSSVQEIWTSVNPVLKFREDKGLNIVFENVNFSYIPDVPVLKNISFSLEPGKSLAIVGQTGSGKSTIVNLILRFYDATSGRILINGINIKELDTAWLRSRIGLVLQDVFLFSGDIRSNILLGRNRISEDVLNSTVKYVNADSFIRNLPRGLGTELGEDALTLSVGERQLLSFSRAIAHNPELLILDEATSSIDTETEDKIQKSTALLMKDRTSIVIAHRLSTVQEADKIMVLDRGEIQEFGTHEELLKSGGIYYSLFSLA